MNLIKNKKDMIILYERIYNNPIKPNYITYDYFHNGKSEIQYIIENDDKSLDVNIIKKSNLVLTYTTQLTIEHFKNMNISTQFYLYEEIESYLNKLHIEIETEKLLEKI